MFKVRDCHIVLQEASSDQNAECTTPEVEHHEDLEALEGGAGETEKGGNVADGPDIRLPEGWEVLIDDDTGVDYYHHVESGHVQWEMPGPVTVLIEESLPTSTKALL